MQDGGTMSDYGERLSTLERDMKKVRELAGELAVVLWGDMVLRNNGVRSKVAALEQFQREYEEKWDTLTAKLQHYMDFEREDTCFGLKELARIESCHEEDLTKEANMEIATMQTQVQREVARTQNRGIVVNSIISGIALIIVALISLSAK